jgi:hypothetical protein
LTVQLRPLGFLEQVQMLFLPAHAAFGHVVDGVSELFERGLGG